MTRIQRPAKPDWNNHERDAGFHRHGTKEG